MRGRNDKRSGSTARKCRKCKCDHDRANMSHNQCFNCGCRCVRTVCCCGLK